MRSILELGKVLVLLTVLIVFFDQSAYAQTARKLNKELVTVRLCPTTCKTVNGHGLKPGGNVTVLETRSGWVRVSPYLDRKTLVSAFGNKITKRPALWISEANLVSAKAKSADPVKKQPTAVAKKKKPATVAERIGRLKRIPIPVFRPDPAAPKAAKTTQQPVEEAKNEEAKVEEVKTEEPKVEAVKVEEPKVETAKPVVVDAKPIASVAKGTTSKKALSWEEVQAKIAAQGGQTNKRTVAKAETVEPVKVEEPKPKKVEPVVKASAPEPKSEPKVEEPKVVEPAPTPKPEVAPKKEEQVAAVEASNTAANAEPISFGERPKKLTKSLLDKRLNKLPGAKSKVKKNVVIALRHYALGLLNSGACKGIAGGGKSATPGMLFVSCVEDPDYLRQFPLKELSW